MPRFLVLALSYVFVLAAVAQQTAGGTQAQSALIYSDSTSFWINTPRGWVLDSESGRGDGAIAVLYRQGESWQTGDPVMYASVITPKSGFSAVIPAAVRSDSARWAGQAPDFVFSALDSIRTISGTFAHMRAYQSTSTHRFETVAYLQADGRVWMLALTARSRAAHDAAYADFAALVNSYAPGPMRPL